MTARIVKRFRFKGREYVIGPRLNLIAPGDKGQEVRSSIHHVGGLISPVIVHRLGAYVGGVV